MSITQHSQDARQARVRPKSRRQEGPPRQVCKTALPPCTRCRSPSEQPAAHAAPCLRPQPCAVHAHAASRPAHPGPPAKRRAIRHGLSQPDPPPLPLATPFGGAPPPPPPRTGSGPHAGMCATHECAWQLESRTARGPASARMQAMRSPPRPPRDAGLGIAVSRPKGGRPHRHAFDARYDKQGRADAASGGGPVGAGQVLRRRMRASAGAPCILVRSMRQAVRTPRCPPGAASGQAQARAGGRTRLHPIPHRILRVACPAGGLGRVGGSVPPCRCRTPGAQMLPQNCVPLFQIEKMIWRQKLAVPRGYAAPRPAARFRPTEAAPPAASLSQTTPPTASSNRSRAAGYPITCLSLARAASISSLLRQSASSSMDRTNRRVVAVRRSASSTCPATVV